MRTSILGRVTLNLFQTRSVHIGRVTLDIRKGALFRQVDSVHNDHMQAYLPSDPVSPGQTRKFAVKPGQNR